MATEDGLPDVDLSPIVESLEREAQDKAQEGADKTAQADVKEKVNEDLAQFKSPEDLLKSYKELQATFTRTSQHNKELESRMAELEEQIQLSRAAPPNPQDPNFDTRYLDNPQAAIQQQYLTMRIVEVLEDEKEKDEGAFQERYSYAQNVIRQYPNLGRSVNGIKKAFQYGDKLRKENLKQSASKNLEAIFGEPLSEEQISNLRQLVTGKKESKTDISNAYMPDTTSTTHTQNQNQRPDYDKTMTDAVNNGDVDGVISGIFQRVLAE